jgi:hypothetical protein
MVKGERTDNHSPVFPLSSLLLHFFELNRSYMRLALGPFSVIISPVLHLLF